jgi:hypothetical protein
VFTIATNTSSINRLASLGLHVKLFIRPLS